VIWDPITWRVSLDFAEFQCHTQSHTYSPDVHRQHETANEPTPPTLVANTSPCCPPTPSRHGACDGVCRGKLCERAEQHHVEEERDGVSDNLESVSENENKAELICRFYCFRPLCCTLLTNKIGPLYPYASACVAQSFTKLSWQILMAVLPQNPSGRPRTWS
jgi:hypothetical protein